MLKDTEIKELCGLPVTTLRDMKKKESTNWRYKVYNYLKIQNRDTVINTFEVLNIDTASKSQSD